MLEALAAQIGALALFAVALLALHELAHVAVARVYGYPMVCLGFSPLAIGIVFLDQPSMRYWVLQVVVPMAVTAAVTLLGLLIVPLITSASEIVFTSALPRQLGFSLVLSVLTSSGDLAGMVLEMRRPVGGRDRVLRDVRLLRRIGSLIRFTPFGRRYLAEEFGQSPDEFLNSLAGVRVAEGT